MPRITPVCAVVCFLVAAPLALPQQPSTDLSDLVKSSIDAVVQIVVSDTAGKPIAEGSGFIVSADGKVVTNHHVIAGGASAVAKLNSGAFFPIEGVLVDDPGQDLTLLKVKGQRLPYLNLGDSDSVAVGQHVLAIGSPLGLENSASDGIVSGIRTEGDGKGWIQTTAPVSPGNSGGPLLLMDGRAIGVITWKAKGGENLNFAIPSKLIIPLLQASTLHSLDSNNKPPAPVVPLATGERLWTSMTTGHDYKIRADGDFIYVEWANLPVQLAGTAAFSRMEAKKTGDKWVGTGRSLLPYAYKSSYMDFWKTGQQMGTQNVNWCRVEQEVEITKITETRIEGRAKWFSSFDAKKCRAGKMEWRDFVWIPK